MTNEESITIFVVVLVFVLIFFGIFFVANFGQSDGDHTGFITSVEKSGIVWKTWSAYVKTDVQSSQEDRYCVTDEKVVKELVEYSKTRELVNIHYHSPMFIWNWQCHRGEVIIDQVDKLPIKK